MKVARSHTVATPAMDETQARSSGTARSLSVHNTWKSKETSSTLFTQLTQPSANTYESDVTFGKGNSSRDGTEIKTIAHSATRVPICASVLSLWTVLKNAVPVGVTDTDITLHKNINCITGRMNRKYVTRGKISRNLFVAVLRHTCIRPPSKHFSMEMCM
jgi:hypothetical protein